MRIVSRLQGGLERRQHIFTPETLVKSHFLSVSGLRSHHAAHGDAAC